MVPWGDPGPAVIFAAGMFAMLWRPARIQMLSIVTLTAVFGYIVLRGVVGI